MSSTYYTKLQASLDSVSIAMKPKIALIIGSGLGGLLDQANIVQTIPYSHIAGFQRPSAPSHKGELQIALFGKTPVLVFNGRIHLYEGRSAQDVALPVYLAGLLGITDLVITNAAGSLNPDFTVGDVMVIEDHINFTGHNPLIGLNDEWLGPRFPDMSRAYHVPHREKWQQLSAQENVPMRSGVYVGVSGPSLETSAERRMMRICGGDAVGMSSVLEVIAANHTGLNVLGLSAIANVATGAVDQPVDDIESVLAGVEIAGIKMASVLHRYFSEFA